MFHREDFWLFERVNGLSIYGGTLDGQGTGLWACKNSGKHCPQGATSLGFYNSNKVLVSGLSSLNSQFFHINLDGCQNTRLEGVKISAPENSPNTDGIHVQSSSGVAITNSHIGTGDDCISLGPGSSNIWIENINCGPGHGISIGSLGSNLQEPGVKNVTVKTVTLSGTQNGLRIKTWPMPSNGFVTGVLFQHAVMVNVKNPIIIDQNYCPNRAKCLGQASGVRISDVTYQDVHGTSATEVAVNFYCSKKYPCSRIILEDVNLSYKDRPATASCSLGFYNSNNVLVSGLSSLNSQIFHIILDGCKNTRLEGVKISAPENSPNTDGIHVQSSSGVAITNSHIGTGDDCISLGPGSSNIWIENINCGPGHGISIGSLGSNLQEPGVKNVTVKTVTLSGTQNGLRIKTWAMPSNGFVTGVLFQHAVMVNVQNPIIIDQNYCPNRAKCPGQASGVRISDVTYQDVHGTSATEVAVNFYCSKKYPCSRIILEDVNLSYKDRPATASCVNAGGSSSGFMCL
ncbi:unnamed protein product [Coffea canephora]|uniref:Polygalacturonase n=1 Tax=Coffea canephora TaxID=49390 RepID=A0A068UKK9_COFCA|nr:unnamed protein product [Coffea canephora]